MNKDNTLKTVFFEGPDYIPMRFHVNGACWKTYDPEALWDLMESHSFLFPDFVRPRKGKGIVVRPLANQPYEDGWGCVLETGMDGIAGTVVEHPLADWSDFDDYVPPDPLAGVDWDARQTAYEAERAKGNLAGGGLTHGHTFLRLCDLRGYENLTFDMIDESPKLWELIEMIESFNMALVEKFVELDVDWMQYPEDLGMQIGPMISPEMFRKYVKPSYERLMKPARDRGCVVHMHSDGDIRDLVDDLIDGGVQVINLQDLVNGIDWIKERFAGKVCVDLDIDRQEVTVNGTPAMIDDLIRREVEEIGSKRGGLMMIYGLYPGVPLANVKAVMDAMEKYAFYYE